jgi:putative RNA 2'-phosphotransferase
MTANGDRLVQTSKFLSYVLRHRPDSIGISLDEQGWIDIATLLDACARHGHTITRDELEHLVHINDKQRFAIDATTLRIRANQGHSVMIDLALVAKKPPEYLYHGTADRFLSSIMANGLHKRGRHHVHLSLSISLALTVGRRHGRPVVIVVQSAAMHDAGFEFYESDNGVWLVDCAPIDFLSVVPTGGE